MPRDTTISLAPIAPDVVTTGDQRTLATHGALVACLAAVCVIQQRVLQTLVAHPLVGGADDTRAMMDDAHAMLAQVKALLDSLAARGAK